MYLSKQVDPRILQSCFDLSAYDNLCKTNPGTAQLLLSLPLA